MGGRWIEWPLALALTLSRSIFEQEISTAQRITSVALPEGGICAPQEHSVLHARFQAWTCLLLSPRRSGPSCPRTPWRCRRRSLDATSLSERPSLPPPCHHASLEAATMTPPPPPGGDPPLLFAGVPFRPV